MKQIRIIKDEIDNDMAHIYVEHHFYFAGGKKEQKWLLAASTHFDLLESIFGREVAEEAEAKEDIEALVATHLKEED